MSCSTNDLRDAKQLAKQIAATLTHDETADTLGISPDLLDRIERRGEGPPRFKISGSRWCYPLPELRAWQEKQLKDQNAA
jgi:hypothetical protein